MFELSLLLCAYTPTESKEFLFPYTKLKCVLCSTIYCTGNLRFYFPQNFEEKNGGFAIDEPPRGSVNEPMDRSQNRAFCYRLPALDKQFRLLFECSDSTSVFTSYCVIM